MPSLRKDLLDVFQQEAARKADLNMKLVKTLILIVALLLSIPVVVAAEDAAEAAGASDAAQTLDTLRSQLLEVEAKEAQLEAKAKQLDEDLKPENIERALAGVGSTKPEDLRELRRRQLTIQRDSVRSQLKLLATSRERLQSVIRTAETQAYQQSARVDSPLNQMFGMQNTSLAWRLGMFTGLLAVVGFLIFIWISRRAQVTGK
ncbi:MAG TPA: hypothetical protein VMZ30_05155 [Pyrinomonadaceae bacterium]|nr:hypothetical protein [Pyrinomonadaceae bacterium]